MITKSCPDCGRDLVIRTNKATGTDFLACPGYPSCRHTEPLPEAVAMRQIGHPELPLFDDIPHQDAIKRLTEGV
jgi:ssDNA-binding Zn-finger/Zn-ribbon topoisomerase 1